MIKRKIESELVALARSFPVVTVTGPRQAGKTTLCRAVFEDKAYVSLEDPDRRAFASEDPRGFLAQLREGAIVDEIQRAPDLLSYLQGEVDENSQPGRFVLTGSANLALLSSITQSLAGRTALLTLLPTSLGERREAGIGRDDLMNVMWSGGYPAVADRRLDPERWYASYLATYLERDVRQILNVGDLATFQTFLALCAGGTGQLLNSSRLASDCGISNNTARSWLSVLEASYVVVRVPAFHTNLRKRFVKAPKIHFVDSGLVCYLLGIGSPRELFTHSARGAIFESWVASEILKARFNRGDPADLSHLRTKDGTEVDLIVGRGEHLSLVEVRSGATISGNPFSTFSRIAQEIGQVQGNSEPASLVIYGGDERQTRSDGTVVPWHEVPDLSWGMPSSTKL